MVTEEHAGAGAEGEHYLVRRQRKRRRSIFIGLVLAAAAAGGAYWHQSRDVAPEDQPLIATVVYGDIENTIASAGSLEPSRVVDVGAQVSGQLQRLFVDVGDSVEEGQLLAEIDARVQQNRVEASRASIDALRAQIASREAALQLAQSNAKRQERLMAERATSQLDYDSAMNNLASAISSLIQLEKQIEQSEATLASDETQLEYTRIFAPMSGTVVEVLLNEGVTLNAAQQAPTVLRIADLSRMTVETQISEADVARVRPNMPVYFTTLGGGSRRWYSKLEQILPSPRIENNVVTYTGLFKVDNSDGALLTGMTTQVYFVTSSAENVLTVPVGALTFNDEHLSADRFLSRMGAQGGGAQGAGRMRSGMPAGGLSGAPAGERPEGFPRNARPGLGGGMPSGFPGEGGFGPRGPGSDVGAIGGRSGWDEDEFRPRPALVQVVLDDGTIEEREIVVGVMSRISAEVVAGLEPGDRVIAGIVQTDMPQAASPGNERNFRGGPPMFRMF